MAAVCLWFLRVPLLRLAAWPLIACEPVAGAKYLWIPSSPLEAFDSPRCFDLVHDLYAEDMSRKVLIVRPAPERIVRLGAVPDFETVLRAELRVAVFRVKCWLSSPALPEVPGKSAVA